MSYKRWPFIQWFVGDWLGDPKVSLCSPETRGILFDLLCHMHLLDRSGQITGNSEQLARAGRCTPVQLDAALQELERTNAADVTFRYGLVTVTNRRMRREHKSRKETKLRVIKHRGKEACNASVTQHNQNQSQNHIPDTVLKSQSSQRDGPGVLSGSGGSIDLTSLTRDACKRVAAEIAGNNRSWHWDNCKVSPNKIIKRSLETSLSKFVGRITEQRVHEAWQEAVRRAHSAAVDQLVGKSVEGYAVACWCEIMQRGKA